MAANGRPFYPGWVIFLVLFVFFPAGFVLIFLRASKHRNYPHLRLLDYKICANTLLVLFILMTVSYINSLATDGSPILEVYLVCIAFLLLPSIFMYVKANRSNKAMLLRYDQYRSMIYEQRLTSMAQIAANVGMQPIVVGHELERMSYLGLLPNVHIDPITHTIVLISDRANPPTDAADRSPPRTLNCSTCGARTVLRPGESKECDYCHTIVSYA
ncbi:hypothetical protein [Cohnella sp.]|uniref:hypothetical protein n=1 Tax=Cohnella sp. TaxID=1883426 RepID=UPI00370416BA